MEREERAPNLECLLMDTSDGEEGMEEERQSKTMLAINECVQRSTEHVQQGGGRKFMLVRPTCGHGQWQWFLPCWVLTKCNQPIASLKSHNCPTHAHLPSWSVWHPLKHCSHQHLHTPKSPGDRVLTSVRKWCSLQYRTDPYVLFLFT